MKIRSERPDDRKAIRDIVKRAFDQYQESKLVDELRTAGDLMISLVAEVDGHICGHVALSKLKSPTMALALAPVAVLPDKQGQGFGSALIREALRGAKRLGIRLVFVLGEPSYYTRFGFLAATAAPYPCSYAGPYFMAVTLDHEDSSTPAPVIYTSAFDNLE